MLHVVHNEKMINNCFVQKHLVYKMSNTTRRLLVAGYGRMGQIRCRDIFANPRLQLAGLVETNSDRKNQFFLILATGTFQFMIRLKKQYMPIKTLVKKKKKMIKSIIRWDMDFNKYRQSC